MTLEPQYLESLDQHQPRRSLRPEIRARNHAISTGHPLATQAGMRILDQGGNAVDAGVCAGICLGFLLADFVSFAGVAPILYYEAEAHAVHSVAGVGCWPKAATLDEYVRRYKGDIPNGIPRTVLPAAPDAWITALRKWGTLSFGEVAKAAIELCAEGFPMYELMAMRTANAVKECGAWPTWAGLFMPGGRTPKPGEVFRQTEAAKTLERMAAAEARASAPSRDAGLQAARDEFYKGETAERIASFMKTEDTLLTYEDLASYQVQLAPPVSTDYKGWQVYTCGPWSQGPALPMALTILSGYDLQSLSQPDYLHVILEALKLVFADRERYIGDPDFVEVPLEMLLSDDYAAQQRRRMSKTTAPGSAGASPAGAAVRSSADTTYIAVVDHWGNAFSATPSDGFNAPVVPGVGIVLSTRGSQSWLDSNHPSVLAPGKRPRLTPNPAIAVKDGMVLPFGTPGGDVQIQAMLQTFLNIVEFGMTPQQAVEQPRVTTYNAPDSFWPHKALPNVVRAESRFPAGTLQVLVDKGHKLERWPDWTWLAGGMSAILADRNAGVMTAAADPRREAYALGW